eukprot:TRINITY_DN8248_c0_g1_i3.p1 TRINITY_DN8248_c0_g1~~TRINITY_DN8248_c0_g1_i3.p1  ORF type:complete len:379 (+),score=44.98 TRINITY_DN8248_c0_g1_i3:65-1201(+)
MCIRDRYGAYGIEVGHKNKVHMHTKLAFQYLEDNCIGEVHLNQNSILASNTAGDQSKIGDKEDVSLIHPSYSFGMEWTLVSKASLSNTLARFDFSAKSYKIRANLKGLTWIGRHFLVQGIDMHTKAREYTTVICMSSSRIDLRKQLVAAFDELIQNGTTNTSVTVSQTEAEVLSLYVKLYNRRRAFTQYLFNALESGRTRFRIDGPMGEGLELEEHLNGEIYLFVAGTGILPILDFLNYALEYLLYSVVKDKHGASKASTLNPLGNDFDRNSLEKVRIRFICAISTQNDFVGKDIITKLAQVSSEHRPDFFRAWVRMSDRTNVQHVENVQEYFSEAFLRKNVTSTTGKYLICGPPRFNLDNHTWLLSMGVPKSAIHFV